MGPLKSDFSKLTLFSRTALGLCRPPARSSSRLTPPAASSTNNTAVPRRARPASVLRRAGPILRRACPDLRWACPASVLRRAWHSSLRRACRSGPAGACSRPRLRTACGHDACSSGTDPVFRSKVDGLLPHTLHVNLRIVGQRTRRMLLRHGPPRPPRWPCVCGRDPVSNTRRRVSNTSVGHGCVHRTVLRTRPCV
jgi:hypothetical protein